MVNDTSLIHEAFPTPKYSDGSEAFDFRRSPATVGGYNSEQTINLKGAADAAKWDVENSFEQGARDKSWKSDPTNPRNK